jgi:hypothetical protein
MLMKTEEKGESRPEVMASLTKQCPGLAIKDSCLLALWKVWPQGHRNQTSQMRVEQCPPPQDPHPVDPLPGAFYGNRAFTDVVKNLEISLDSGVLREKRRPREEEAMCRVPQNHEPPAKDTWSHLGPMSHHSWAFPAQVWPSRMQQSWL